MLDHRQGSKGEVTCPTCCCAQPLFASFGIKDAEEKLKKTQEALQGTVANRTNLLGAYLVGIVLQTV